MPIKFNGVQMSAEEDENAIDITREEAIETLGDREAERAVENGDAQEALEDIYKNGIKGFSEMTNLQLREEYIEQINEDFTGQITGEKTEVSELDRRKLEHITKRIVKSWVNDNSLFENAHDMLLFGTGSYLKDPAGNIENWSDYLDDFRE